MKHIPSHNEMRNEYEEYYRDLIEASLDILIIVNVLGIITDVNQQACKVTGYSKNTLIGSAFKEYFTEPEKALEAIQTVLAEDKITHQELTLLSENGNTILISYHATILKNT